MAGHLGVDRVTTLNLKVRQTDVERGLILVEGAVPGVKGGWITVRDAVKKRLPDGVPKPGKFKLAEGVSADKADEPAAAASEVAANPESHAPQAAPAAAAQQAPAPAPAKEAAAKPAPKGETVKPAAGKKPKKGE